MCFWAAKEALPGSQSALRCISYIYLLYITGAPIKGKTHWKFMRADIVCWDGSVGTAVVYYANTHQWTLYNINYINTHLETLQNADYLPDVWRQ